MSREEIDSYHRMPPELRYQRDVTFKALVDNLYCFVANCEFTPTELREAVVLACIKHETTRARSWRLVPDPGAPGGARVEELRDELRAQRRREASYLISEGEIQQASRSTDSVERDETGNQSPVLKA